MHYSTLLRVELVGENNLIGILPGWRPMESVIIPLAQMPPEIRAQVKSGTRLLVEVNLGAATATELSFKNFTFAPLPNPEDGLA